MNAEIVPWFALVVTLLGATLTFVWRASEWRTEHNLRIGALEKSDDAKAKKHDKLETAIDELTTQVFGLRADLKVANAIAKERASQGNFDNGDTEPPRRGT